MEEKKYIEREAIIAIIRENGVRGSGWSNQEREDDVVDMIESIPAADVVEEDNILKFYYVRSIDEYWIGRRIDNFYYAEYDPKCRQWIWTHSRYLPWGEHVVSPTSLWKEHTYPSEPEEIPFEEWLQGFIKKHTADVLPVLPVVRGKWILKDNGEVVCSECNDLIAVVGNTEDFEAVLSGFNFCPNCGADMREIINE